MKITYSGIVDEKGTLYIYNRKAFDNEMKMLTGKKVDITITKKRKTRSLNQNAYYYGVVVPLVHIGLIDVGYKVGKEQTHDFLKSMFAKKELINEITGETLSTIGSTATMTTVEFMEFINDIQRWSSEYLSVDIPSPNEQIDIYFN